MTELEFESMHSDLDSHVLKKILKHTWVWTLMILYFANGGAKKEGPCMYVNYSCPVGNGRNQKASGATHRSRSWLGGCHCYTDAVEEYFTNVPRMVCLWCK